MWKLIERTAAVTGILGFALSIYILFAVRDINELLENAGKWKELSVAVDAPKNGQRVEGHIVNMTGSVRFEAYRPSDLKSLRLVLLQNKIELVPMVKPITEPLRWWPQALLTIGDKGEIGGTVRIGESAAIRNPIEFDIVVLAAPAGSIDLRETYESFPAHYAQSNLSRVVRTR